MRISRLNRDGGLSGLLEDADYEGHSLTMLSQIAAALQQRVEISFVPLGKQRQAA